MFTKKVYKLLKGSKADNKHVIVHVGTHESFKGTITEVTPYYVTIRKTGGKEKVLTSYRTKWIKNRRQAD